jgi:hypothetical protein
MPNSRFTLLIVFLSLLTLVGCRRSAVDRTLLKVDENGFISWEDGKRLILSGETRSVARTHARVVSITLKDETTYKTKEEGTESVVQLIKDNGLEIQINME